MQRQFEFNDHILTLCHLAALNAWEKFKVSGKKSGSFTKIIQDSKEVFTNFLQRLILDINRVVSNPEDRQILIKSLIFENANSEFKAVIRPLKARSIPTDY